MDRLPIASLGRRPEHKLKGHRGPKSKTGCLSCKSRRIKCDETKPECVQCRRKGLTCAYASHNNNNNNSNTPKTYSSGSGGPPSVSSPSSHSAALSLPNKKSPKRHGVHGTPLPIDQLLIGGSPRTTSEPSPSSSFDDEVLLLNTFFATATHLLSVYTGDCNPFMRLRKYVLQSRAASLALQAMASFIASGYQVDDRIDCMNRGLELQHAAYQEIQAAMQDEEARRTDALFAAIVHIGMTEPWHPIRANESGAMHLQASKMLIVERARAHMLLPPRFLVNLVVYWDMLVSLHSDTTVDGFSPEMLQGRCSDEHPIDFIDPTLGIGRDLFPIIIEVENFLRGVRVHPTDLDEQHALELELRLQSWKPELDPDRLQGCLDVFKTCRLEDLIFTSEAYRQCSLLLLYRTFPHALQAGEEEDFEGVSRQHMLQSVASRVINLLRSIDGTSPTTCTHQWILFVVAPDVVSHPERLFITSRMNLLLEKVGIEGIADVTRYIENVWHLQDNHGQPSSAWMDGMYERRWFPLLG
ncbi:hypothetical protein PYCC9005_005183 [Savitreella phatthalungensis]